MTVYFRITDLLERYKTEDKVFCPVFRQKGKMPGPAEGVFVLSGHTERILDLNASDAGQTLASLIEEVPLYGVNLELALDKALRNAANDEKLSACLKDAFQDIPLPRRLESAGGPGLPSSELAHPGLGDLPMQTKCDIYTRLLAALEAGDDRPAYEDLAFLNAVTGSHPDRFLETYDGCLGTKTGFVKATLLLRHGVPGDHDPARPLDDYVADGRHAAEKRDFSAKGDILSAWLDADQEQKRRCGILDIVLKQTPLGKQPGWVRGEVFHLLRQEAMKQHFAALYKAEDPDLASLQASPALKRAVSVNAADQVDDTLQKLLGQVLNAGVQYAGSAAQFAESAAARAKESKNVF